MTVLLYTTVGFSEKYLELLNLYCDSLCYSNKQNKHLLVICDTSFQSRVIDILSKYAFLKWYIHVVEDSLTPVNASMHKLYLFDFKDIHHFSIALYVDVDCLFTDSYELFLTNPIQDGKLYVYQEGKVFQCETYSLWSIKDGKAIGWFNDKHLDRIYSLGKKPFNAGLFMFRISPLMESHFRGLNKFIENYKGAHFYEQSFMNTWFSLNDFTDNTIFRKDNVAMMTTHNQFKDYTTCKHAIMHFNMKAAMGVEKHTLMTKYIDILKQENKHEARIFHSRELMVSVLIPEYAKITQIGDVKDDIFGDHLVSKHPSKLLLIDEWSDHNIPRRIMDKFQFNPNVALCEDNAETYFKMIKKNSLDVLILAEATVLEKAYEYVRTYGLIFVPLHNCEKFKDAIIAQSVDTYCLQKV